MHAPRRRRNAPVCRMWQLTPPSYAQPVLREQSVSRGRSPSAAPVSLPDVAPAPSGHATRQAWMPPGLPRLPAIVAPTHACAEDQGPGRPQLPHGTTSTRAQCFSAETSHRD